MNESLPSVGLIGLGVMGSSMAGHLIQAGYRLTVYSRTRPKALPILGLGAAWAETPAEIAGSSEVIISMVGNPSDVQSVYLGKEGIIQTIRKGSLAIDMTTSSPSLAREIHDLLLQKGVSALDAPVTGGDIGARNATLSIMVGGDSTAFEKARPILEKLGRTVVHQGGPGLGQQAKLCNQIMVAGTMIGVAEGLRYAQRAGVDPEKLLRSIRQGAAGSWTLDHLAPRILKDDLEPGFTIEHFVKDMKLVLHECEKMGIRLRGLEVVRELYESLLKKGYARKGTQALILAV